MRHVASYRFKTKTNVYNIHIRKGIFDNEMCYESVIDELSDVSEYGDTQSEVLYLAVDTIEKYEDIIDETTR